MIHENVKPIMMGRNGPIWPYTLSENARRVIHETVFENLFRPLVTEQQPWVDFYCGHKWGKFVYNFPSFGDVTFCEHMFTTLSFQLIKSPHKNTEYEEKKVADHNMYPMIE